MSAGSEWSSARVDSSAVQNGQASTLMVWLMIHHPEGSVSISPITETATAVVTLPERQILYIQIMDYPLLDSIIAWWWIGNSKKWERTTGNTQIGETAWWEQPTKKQVNIEPVINQPMENNQETLWLRNETNSVASTWWNIHEVVGTKNYNKTKHASPATRPATTSRTYIWSIISKIKVPSHLLPLWQSCR